MYVGSIAARLPDKPAIVTVGVDGAEEVLTYGELDGRSTALAKVLRSAGLKPGDAYAVMAANHPRVSELYWAGQRSGLYYTPVNVRLSEDEIAYVLRNSHARAVIVAPRYAELARAALAHAPDVKLVLALDDGADGFARYEEAIAAAPEGPLSDELEGTAMIYSSGTTGRPKGIKRPQSGNAPGGTVFGLPPGIESAWGLTEESVGLVPAPVYHSSGLTRLMISQSIGMTTIAMERFDALEALRVMERHGVTHSLWVATMFVRLLQLDPAERDRFDLAAHVGATVGSGPCPAHVKERMIEWWGPIITETYGGTEGNGMTRITSEEWLAHRGSVGKPVFGEIHVLDDDGNELSAGDVGTIYFGGGRPFEYHDDPEQTASVFTAQGWSTLGDVGHVDADGYLFLSDRKSDMIIVGGINVYPAEVEAVLLEHPGVRDVAVIGVPDEVYGEAVKAIVEPIDAAAGAGLVTELEAFCRTRLAKFKLPASFDLVDALPRQPTGKLAKRLLRDRYRSGSAGSSI
ncbi:MAG TPA: AMP-binding protein [Conexibacter sp.]|jgi:acyl-CoA synthetase (AMP-forming)/AMP-acid ligase II